MYFLSEGYDAAMTEPRASVQWLIIVIGVLAGLAACVWMVMIGYWYVAALVVAASVYMGVRAMREGKPPYPGADRRRLP